LAIPTDREETLPKAMFPNIQLGYGLTGSQSRGSAGGAGQILDVERPLVERGPSIPVGKGYRSLKSNRD
jgi:hypothetical protein